MTFKKPDSTKFMVFCIVTVLMLLYHKQRLSETLCPVLNHVDLQMSYPCGEISLVRATTYNCTGAQCDSNPFSTADGSIIDPVKLKNKEINWVALSRDLIWDKERQGLFSDTTLWRGDFAFGDTITVYSKKYPHLDGEWVVHDCMAESYRMSIDFLMDPENNYPKLGVGTDVKIVFCAGDKRNKD